MSKSTQVAEKKNTAVTTAEDMAFDFSQDVGAGMETADKDSFAIPFLAVIQKMSPQVDEAEAEYIEDARPGMLFNSVTQELFDGKEGLVFLPCAYQRRYIRWGAKDIGGGFKGEYMPDEVDDMLESGEVSELEGRLYFPDDNGKIDEKKADQLKDTRNHFGILLDEETGQAQQVLLSLASTQIKKSKQLMSMLNSVKVKGANGMVTPPTWACRIRVNTVGESNDKGSWHGVKFSHDEQKFVGSQDVYNAGKEFHDLVTAGEAKINYAAAEAADEKPDAKGEKGKF